eukprot:146273-Pyramimonas_sp.AAC.1
MEAARARMKQVEWLGQPGQNEGDYCIIAVLRFLQLHIDDDEARFQIPVRRPDATAPNSDFAQGQALAIRAIGGQSC